ncbi:MAG: hypothetical protein U9O56_06695, partial [Campylobacterota bacterium]|nr:hypothetical protein [Campylobacterota bacterium]
MNYNFIYKFIILIFIFLIIGCGGGFSSSESNTSTTISDNNDSVITNLKQAVFKDSPVVGISYSCSDSTTTGTTNENGTFEYDENCGTITFFIGGVTVYSTDIIPDDQQLYIT